jgi:hypothetical protein
MMMTGPINIQPVKTQAVAKAVKFPAAVGGLNKRDGKADMPVTDANILDNVIPRPNYVELRRGYESYATGMTGEVRTFMDWAGPAGVSKAFAVNAGSIYDISTPGPVGVADVTMLNSSDFQFINFATAGGNFLFATSGADAPLNYNGTVWATTPAITGVTAAGLIFPTKWKNRIWLVEKNTTDAWYLPVNSIGGAATKLPLGPQFKMGGYLVAIGTFSGDTGNGPDDFISFISSRGEIAVYQGTDPSSTTTFSIVGTYTVAPPVSGHRMLLNVGGDLAIITIEGVVSMKLAMGTERSVQGTQAAITNKIQDLFNQYARDYKNNYGWQGQIYPKGSYVLFNVPFSTTQYVQLVMNTDTGSWCRFINQNSVCWGLFNDDLYFGGTNGVVYKADSSRQDNGALITFDYQSAWSDFGAKGLVKLFQEGVSLITTNGSPSVLQAMNVDFVDQEPAGTLNPTAMGDSLWGSAQWGIGTWGGDTSLYEWFSIGNIGTWGAIRIKGIGNGVSLQINAFTITLEGGAFH